MKQVDICLQILADGSGPNLSSLFDSADTLLTDEQINDTASRAAGAVHRRIRIGTALGPIRYSSAGDDRPQRRRVRCGLHRGSFFSEGRASPGGRARRPDARSSSAGRCYRCGWARRISRAIWMRLRASRRSTVHRSRCWRGPAMRSRIWSSGFESEGIVCRRLRTSHAFHSSMMDPAREPFLRLLGSVRGGHARDSVSVERDRRLDYGARSSRSELLGESSSGCRCDSQSARRNCEPKTAPCWKSVRATLCRCSRGSIRRAVLNSS